MSLWTAIAREKVETWPTPASLTCRMAGSYLEDSNPPPVPPKSSRDSESAGIPGQLHFATATSRLWVSSDSTGKCENAYQAPPSDYRIRSCAAVVRAGFDHDRKDNLVGTWGN